MGATATHRAPERVADGTCTQVWAWITNKCRKRMNRGGVYIYSIRDLPGEKRKKEKGQAPGKREEPALFGPTLLAPI